MTETLTEGKADMPSTEDIAAKGNTQYNQIVDVYSKLYPPGGQTSSEFILAPIEEHQVYTAVTDPSIDVRGKRVLDLAAGNGHYSCKYLSWGAESVTGVDISGAMLDLTRQDARKRGIPESKLRYVLGDVMDPDHTIQGGPFDIVASCWLLNYAPNRATMTAMWTFIGRHLKPGSVFVGMTIPPLLTDQTWEKDMLNTVLSPTGAWGRHGNEGRVLESMPNGDGYKMLTELRSATYGGAASFENYHLQLAVFEESCQRSGLFKGLEWRDFVMHEDTKAQYPVGFFNDYVLWPSCRVCVARRG